jgi:hypothetical protein
MSQPELKVVEFPYTNITDIVASIRELADDIEAGLYGDVTAFGAALLGDKMEVFGFGGEGAPSIGLLLHAGFMRISASLERHGQ